MKTLIITVAAGVMGTNSILAQANLGTSAPASNVTDSLTSVDIRKVKVGGELGQRIDLTVHGNLLKIDVEKDFLAPFSGGKYTGLNDGSGPFIGVGKTLDGMVRLAANTGDKALIARKEHMVDTLIATQEGDGYIGMMAPDKRTWTLWDLHEQAFIIKAFVSDYQYFGKRNSLVAARKLAEFLIKRWPEKPPGWENSLPIREYFAELGLSASFLSLYAVTGDLRYVDFVANELGEETWNVPIVIGRRPPVDGHSYMYLSHCLAQMELYRLRPNERLLAPTHRAIEFMTDEDGMTITGGVGQDECWTDNQQGKGNLGETCSTAYQIFVFDSLMRLDGDSRWGDLIERNLYNAALGAESPDGRHLRYYTPFEGKRVYFAYDTYCCPGNFRRLMGFVPQLIYYRFENGLALNLYSESQATLDGVGGTSVTISQETDYPTTGRVTVHIEPRERAPFPLILRIPRWSSGTTVSVNGQPFATVAKGGKFLKIDRTWQPGDRVTIEMPMPWRFVAGRMVQAGRAAVMRGPLVYTLNPARNSAIADADPKRLVLLPDTAELAGDDTAVRSGGTVCRINADLDKAGSGALSLTLTEFPDPDGQLVYFQVSDLTTAVDDELFAGK
jgi:uncharacterized protein